LRILDQLDKGRVAGKKRVVIDFVSQFRIVNSECDFIVSNVYSFYPAPSGLTAMTGKILLGCFSQSQIDTKPLKLNLVDANIIIVCIVCIVRTWGRVIEMIRIDVLVDGPKFISLALQKG
jgi:hypothetical protein